MVDIFAKVFSTVDERMKVNKRGQNLADFVADLDINPDWKVELLDMFATYGLHAQKERQPTVKKGAEKGKRYSSIKKKMERKVRGIRHGARSCRRSSSDCLAFLSLRNPQTIEPITDLTAVSSPSSSTGKSVLQLSGLVRALLANRR